MDIACIRFRCPSCRARIKAPSLLAGRARSCPGCKCSLTVPRAASDDAGAVLVAVEGADHYKLGMVGGLDAGKPAARRWLFS